MSHSDQDSCLVIDTSFGSTVGLVGHEPLIETDSRSHVEKLEPHIRRVIEAAGIQPEDLGTIVVGTGPAPFTGLRAGIVTARALSFVCGANLLGQNIVEAQALWYARKKMSDSGKSFPQLVLAVNDARRKQLYYALYDVSGIISGNNLIPQQLTDLNIASASTISLEISHFLASHPAYRQATLAISGRGAGSYMQAWDDLEDQRRRMHSDSGCTVSDLSCLVDGGAGGVDLFAAVARAHQSRKDPCSTDPLYLRRPDITVPTASRHKLGETAVSLTLTEKNQEK